ncbi:MAG: hypothetical protein COC19_03940 [SAR86 cluster bacterium]|uniref:Uncharacterized protein n=1 Tax=SAR86 cluster bacterium TaxID=2030880 RepID=A0A2A4MPP4_9GAMM|nr:MAG: hypothetical protein COC19_03940 [SAR86 cluster bacterium]
MLPEIEKNKKWKKQHEQLKKVQLLFSFADTIDKAIREEAVVSNTTPSNVLRNLIGLETGKAIRPRLGVSFSEEDFKFLAGKYNIDINDRKLLTQKVTSEVQHYYRKLDDDN